jgi:chloramphenicol-sensitive protein RarD
MADQQTQGVWIGLSGYVLWGLSPIFWKALNRVEAMDIVSWRVICTFIFVYACNAVLKSLKRGKGFFLPFSNNWLSMLGGILIGFNWGIFVWAVESERVVEASLGYFMNPLMNVFLGVVFLGEALRKAQWMAVVFAAMGVLWLTISLSAFPWVSLTLAISFALYGLIRKIAPASPLQGLTLETSTLLIPAVIFVLLRGNAEENLTSDSTTLILILLSGAVTGIPLLLFASSAKRIPLSILGLLQYVTPTLQFILGVFAYNETFNSNRLIGYSIIWLGLVIFAMDSFRFTSISSEAKE